MAAPRKPVALPRPATYSPQAGAALLVLTDDGVKSHLRRHGHVCGVRPVHNGRRVLISRRLLDRALGLRDV